MHEERLACLAAGESEAEWRERKIAESNARGLMYYAKKPELRNAVKDRGIRFRNRHPKEDAVACEVRLGPMMTHEQKKKMLWAQTFGQVIIHDEASRMARLRYQFDAALKTKSRGGAFRANLCCASCNIMNGLSKIDEMIEIEPHGHVCPECWEVMTENLWDGALL